MTDKRYGSPIALTWLELLELTEEMERMFGCNVDLEM